MTMNGTNMNGKERIKALVKGQPIVINVEDNSLASDEWPLSHSPTLGETIVNKYGHLIDKYAQQYNLDSNIANTDKNIAKIATLWNGTGLRNVNDYGKKAQEYYLNQSWNDPYEMPQLESE